MQRRSGVGGGEIGDNDLLIGTYLQAVRTEPVVISFLGRGERYSASLVNNGMNKIIPPTGLSLCL